MPRSDDAEPRPSARLSGAGPPTHKATAAGEEPGFELELTCLVCGHRENVRFRGEWKCVEGASHAHVHVRAIPASN